MTRLPERPNRRIRVIVNGLHAKSGGGVTYLRNMLPRLADDKRFELHLLLDANQYALFKPVDERVRLHVIEAPPRLWNLMIWEQVSVPIIARMMAADVTFSPANYGPLFAPNPVIMLRNAVAVAGTERRLSKRIYWLGVNLLTRICLTGCQKAIAVSEYARHHLANSIFRRKVTVIHHGVNPVFRPDGKVVEGPPFLLAVADIYVQKNLHTLIESLVRIRQHFPEIKLRIAGRRIDEDYFGQLEKAIERHSLHDHVIFLGELTAEELAALYRSCAAFVFPSTVETFGNPLAEAMACGAPIASSNAAAMPEVVDDAALLFDPMNATDMADHILRILRDPALAHSLSERGIARARNFTWERTAQRTGDVLESVAGQRTITRTNEKDPMSRRSAEM